jgi:hypothetical protein
MDEKELRAKFKKQMIENLGNQHSASREYTQFVNEYKEVPLSFYEKACRFCEKYVGVTPDFATAKTISESANFARIQVTPKGVFSFAIFAPLVFVLVFGMLSFLLIQDFFIFILIIIGGLGAIAPLMNLPTYISDNFRLKASNQMVLSVFYLVTYMRHTSNLERAVEFAANHLSDPLSFEFRSILWDVETGKYNSINDSIEHFLEKWREHNPEFVDAVHLIESSLLESSDSRRLELLDKSLDVILDQTYEKMLHFAHNLQSPITTLHMLGVILPILGLVILPLMLTFLEEVKWFHIAIFYNVFLPIIVYLFGLKILSRRPTGYGETSVNQSNKEIEKATNATVKFGSFDTKLSPSTLAFIVATVLLIIGISPFLMRAFGVADFGFGGFSRSSVCESKICFLEYRTDDSGKEIGPYGLGAAILSLAITLGFGLSLGLYYKYKSGELIKIFEKSKKLEDEFSSSLFQLGNKLGDNIPAEIAILKVAEILPNTHAGNFFHIAATNIQKLGMGIEDAIFNVKIGALVYYPSNLIESSMKVLIQAVKKGPLIASNALINISRYIKEMHKVEQRLEDLMAEVISSMKSQINFLTPIISAIVVGITTMISAIIGTLTSSFSKLQSDIPDSGAGIGGGMGNLVEFFQNGMPPYYFQLIVGIYVVQITWILTIMINTIQKGSDKVNEEYLLGKNLLKCTIMYVLVTAVVMIVFNIVTVNVLPVTGD